jgi:hypothetical protein
MTEGSTDRVLEMINAAQPHLATFARESYAHYGRGVIRGLDPIRRTSFQGEYDVSRLMAD